MAASIALLLVGSKLLGIACIAGLGVGLGLASPAANLLVAEVNPGRRSAALNLLNFSWSTGAVACPFLVAAAATSHQVPLLLAIVAGCALVVVLGIRAMPSTVQEPSIQQVAGPKRWALDWTQRSLPALLALFFLYVGTENSFGGWLASYASSLGSMSARSAVMTPSFFYAALMTGRWVAPLLLRRVDELQVARGGLLLACAGMAGLVASHTFWEVAASASVAGLGLSSVYPITISLLSREFGAAAARVGSLTFTMANIGGACLPWLVGISSTQLGSLKAGLGVPLIGAALTFMVYLRDWKSIPGASL
jgi:fucose permease